MKKSFILSMLAVAATVAFVSCNKVESDQPAAETFTMQVAANASETKVTIGDKVGTKYPVTWDAEGEAVKMLEVLGESYSPYTSSSYTADGKSAKFIYEGIKAKEAGENTFDYYFVSPATAYNAIYPGYYDIKMTLPQIQTASASSADPAAVILYGKNVGNVSQPVSVSADMSAISAIVKLHLRNVPMNGTEEVETVSFAASSSAGAKYLSGQMYYYYNADSLSVVDKGIKYSNVSVTMPEGIKSTEFDVWLSCWPFELAENDKLTITVTTDVNIYSATFTMSEAKSVLAGKVTVIPANMDKSKPVDYSGTYVVLSKNGDNYYSMLGNPTSTYMPMEQFNYDGTAKSVTVSDAKYVWDVAAVTGAYTFWNKSSQKYLAYSGSSNTAELTAEYGETCDMVISAGSGDCVNVNNKKTSARCLRANFTSTRFAFYATNTGSKELLLVPAILDLKPVINPITAPDKVDAAGAEKVEVSYTITNPVEGKSVSAVSAESWVNNFNYDTEGKITFNVDANSGTKDRTSEITVSYEGAKDVKFTVTQSGAGVIDPIVLDLTKKTSGISSYSSSLDYAKPQTGTNYWTIVYGANNNKGWAFFKMGGAKETISSNNPCFIYYNSKVTNQISEITVNIPSGSLSKTGMSVNSWGVYVYSDATMTTQVDYVAGGTITGAAANFSFKPSAGKTWKNCYVKVSWDLANTTKTNGIVYVDNITINF